MLRRLSERPTSELLVLMLCVTVCLILIFAGAAMTYIALTNPVYPLADLVKAYVAALNNILFTLLGLAAGRLAFGMGKPTVTPEPEPEPEPAREGL